MIQINDLTSQNIPPHLYTISQIRPHTSQVLNSYILKRFLGKGLFAKCYEVEDQTTKQHFCAKIIEKSKLVNQDLQQKIMNQIQIHHELKHKNIVEFKRRFQDKTNVYILIELCQKNMRQLLKQRRRLNEKQIKIYCKQILQALVYLKSKRIIHRDLKLQNILLNQKNQIKICDFGLATKILYYGQKKRNFCGTPNYIAPQILSKIGYSYQIDTWSFGIIIYTLFFGKCPFQGKQIKQTYRKISYSKLQMEKNNLASKQLKQILIKILEKDPTQRIEISKLKEEYYFEQKQEEKIQLTSQLKMKNEDQKQKNNFITQIESLDIKNDF